MTEEEDATSKRERYWNAGKPRRIPHPHPSAGPGSHRVSSIPRYAGDGPLSQHPEIDVYSVATFYNQFRLTPPGRHPIRVCMGTACHVKGGHIALAAWERRLKIGPGETTPDREFDLDTVACVGCCAMAPVTVVDHKVEGKADPTRVDGILLSYRLQKEKEEKEKS
jgi:hypothetical protein